MALSRPTNTRSVPPAGTQTGTNRVPSAVLCLDRHSTAYNRGSCGLGLPLSRLTAADCHPPRHIWKSLGSEGPNLSVPPRTRYRF